MPTAVPATVPPSRLCTKFVPPIVFAKEVLGTISIFCQGGTPTIFFLGLESKRVSVLCPNFGRFSNFSGPNAPKIHPGRPSRAVLGQSGGGGTKECHFERFLREKLILLGGFCATFSALFFSSGLRDTKKGVREGLQK